MLLLGVVVVGCVVLLLLPLLVVVKKVTGSAGWCNCRVNQQSLLTALELGLGLGLEPSPLARVAKLVVGVVGVALRLR